MNSRLPRATVRAASAVLLITVILCGGLVAQKANETGTTAAVPGESGRSAVAAALRAQRSEEAENEAEPKPAAVRSKTSAATIEGAAASSARVPGSQSANSGSTQSGEDFDQRQVVRRPHPYGDLPSLRDLYSQLPSADASRLQRFGSNIFTQGTGNADELPMDLPAGPDYVLGPGDSLVINTWGGTSQKFSRAVDREGRVVLPEIAPVEVAGHTVAQAQELIQTALSAQFTDVKVDLSLARLRTIRVYVVGDVQRPGAYDISSLSTPLNVLFAAGGPTARGSLRTVRHYRGRELVADVDLYEFLLHGVQAEVERLHAGDTLLVPPVGPQVAVGGMVHRPAIYELKNERELAQVLNLAGGVLVTASVREINVERVEAHQKRVLLSLNLPDNADQDAMAKALGSFAVRDGDRITISSILPFAEQTVYLEGHVFRPGKYSYREGMTVVDILASYQDVLPEPAQHAEIVRLEPPDFHPSTIEFNLAEMLIGDDPITLRPFDTIRVYGRYEMDAPEVSIHGEVLRPGRYPLSKGMTVASLVKMAGGFKRSALLKEADLVSYAAQNGQTVVSQRQSISVNKAMAGDNSANLVLQPGDVLTIRQLPGWKDIGASVRIDGEVQFPGTYGIEDGEKLSSLIRRAGGFRPGAYPAGAVLERVQVKELAEKSRAELMRRLEAGADLKIAAGTDAKDRLELLEAARHQQEQVLNNIKRHPASGRLVIRINADLNRWANTANDIEMRAGDVVTVPKRPNFVLINGQVYNPSAITYVPGRCAGWYLQQAGGPSELGNRKAVFIVRADGSVVGRSGAGGLWKAGVLSTILQPGDTVVVPERIITGTSVWKDLMSTAQVVSAVAIAARVATSF